MHLHKSDSINSKHLEEEHNRHVPQLYTSHGDESATEVPILNAIKFHRSKHSAFGGGVCSDVYRHKTGLLAGGNTSDGMERL